MNCIAPSSILWCFCLCMQTDKTSLNNSILISKPCLTQKNITGCQRKLSHINNFNNKWSAFFQKNRNRTIVWDIKQNWWHQRPLDTVHYIIKKHVFDTWDSFRSHLLYSVRAWWTTIPIPCEKKHPVFQSNLWLCAWCEDQCPHHIGCTLFCS